MAIQKVDIFLKIDGIEGESKDTFHRSEIEIQSFSTSVSNNGTFSTAGGGGSKHANFHDISFTKYIDKSSPKLFIACATGQHIKKATLTLRKAGQLDKPQDYGLITLTDLLISHYSLSDASGMDLPHEQVTINYAKIEFDYKEQKEDGSLGGSIKVGYDIKESKKS